jgi:GNAT superfamily N-acetyltransferase
MSAKVIQGWFLSGRPKLMGLVQPKMMTPVSLQTRNAAQTKIAARMSGPPVPVFAGRPAAVQRHGSGGAFSVEVGPLGLASGGGRPLPEVVRGKMEAALRADFSNVRVHVGPQAERIGAIAFTIGSDIYFAPGRYQPDTLQGQQLLGHELTHVVQQRAGRVRNPLSTGLAVVQDQALEAEADRMGQRAAAHRVAAQAKMLRVAARPSAPMRISPPISTGPGHYRLTAGVGGRQVGSVLVHARDKSAIEVTDLNVAQAKRGYGIGRQLVASAARTGQQFGKSKVILAAQDGASGHLTRWYKEMGFTQTAVNQRGFPQLEAPISRLIAGTAQRKVAWHGPGTLQAMELASSQGSSDDGSEGEEKEGKNVGAFTNVFEFDEGYHSEEEEKVVSYKGLITFYHATTQQTGMKFVVEVTKTHKKSGKTFTSYKTRLEQEYGKGEFGQGFYCTRDLDLAVTIAEYYKQKDPDPNKRGVPWCVVRFTVSRDAFEGCTVVEVPKENYATDAGSFQKTEASGIGIMRGPIKDNATMGRQYKFEGDALDALSGNAVREIVVKKI